MNIYTTNIDNLFYKIYEKAPYIKLLQDISIKGDDYSGKKFLNHQFEINYYPLHVCIKNKGDYILEQLRLQVLFQKKEYKIHGKV